MSKDFNLCWKAGKRSPVSMSSREWYDIYTKQINSKSAPINGFKENNRCLMWFCVFLDLRQSKNQFSVDFQLVLSTKWFRHFFEIHTSLAMNRLILMVKRFVYLEYEVAVFRLTHSQRCIRIEFGLCFCLPTLSGALNLTVRLASALF